MARPRQRRFKNEGSLGRRKSGIYRPYIPSTDPNKKRQYLGTFYSHDDADTALRLELALRAEAAPTPAQRKLRTFEVVLGEAVDSALKAKTITPATATRNIQQLKVYLAPEASLPIEVFTPSHIVGIFDRLTSTISERTGKPLGPATVRNARAALKLAFAYAYRRRWIEEDVTRRAPYVAKKADYLITEEADDQSASRYRRFTAEENRAFLKAIAGERLYARWLLQYRYGLRPAEVLGLTDSDWDSSNKVLHIRRILIHDSTEGLKLAPLKTDQSKRRLKLDEDTATAIDSWVAERESSRNGARRAVVSGQRRTFLFTLPPQAGEIKPLTPQADIGAWGRLMASSKIQNATRYTLRHNALSFLVEHFPIPVVARIAGHKDINMIITHYLHAADDEVASVGEIFATSSAH